MKINTIEMTTVSVPIIPVSRGGIAPYLGSQDKVGTTRATSILFKVTTDEGITGWGEMNHVLSPRITRVILEDYIKPKLVGKNPFNLKLMMKDFGSVYNPQFNTKYLLTGIETACWDIMGKAVNKPVYELLGGKLRDRVEIAYAFGLSGIEETKEKVLRIREEGFKTIKTKGGKDAAFDVKRTEALREAGGSNLEIRVDMNQGYDTPKALRYLRGVEACDLQYVEQPIKVNQLDDLKLLRERTRTPIGINEDCYIPNNLFEAIKKGCIDIAVIDFEPLGGITELIRLADIAEEAGLPLAHHCGWDMGVKLAAILQATCAMPAFTYPMDSTYQAHEDDVLAERLKIADGAYLVPEGPGLGVQVDEDKLRYLAVEE